MADIFISYSSKHRDTTEKVANYLANQEVQADDAGRRKLTVWWDSSLLAGDVFHREITRQIDQARAVVVIWAEASVTSDWVYAEAMRGAAAGKLVPVTTPGLDRESVPLPFNAFHMANVEEPGSVREAVQRLLDGGTSQHPANVADTARRGWVLEPKHESLPATGAARRPASLLLAKHGVMPFDDIHGLKEDFVAWATVPPPGDAPPLALGRLLHGPGGLGKTRLMIEVCEELTSKHGWLAGFVPRDVRGSGRELSEQALDRLILSGREAAGLMLVVDYAEGRQADVAWLADRLIQRAGAGGPPARLVLLSRGQEWWQEIIQKDQNLQDLCYLGPDTYDEIAMPEAIGRRDRRALFDAAVKAFTGRREAANEPVPTGSPSPELMASLDRDDDYDRPLALGIAALLYASGHDASVGSPGMAGLLSNMLGLEHVHWEKVARVEPGSNFAAAMKNGVALVTLAGGIGSENAADSLLARDPIYQKVTDIDQPRVQRWLRALFPGPGNGLDALEPDLIGEHHVAQAVSPQLVEACLDWTSDNEDQRRTILTVLNRATRPEHGAKADNAAGQLEKLVEAQGARLGADLISVAVSTPGRLLDLCRMLDKKVEQFGFDALADIDRALPDYSLALFELSLHVAERLSEMAKHVATATPKAEDDTSLENLAYLALRLNTLGVRLSNVGRREDALKASEEAVEIYRTLAKDRPDAFLPNLASSLNNISVDLSSLGRREDALKAAEEAVEIRRTLAKDRPDAFLPDLALSLNNLGNRLSDLGRREDALKASGEAVEIRRTLAKDRPDAFLPNLASSLNNLGMILSNLGRREDGSKASEEAVEIYRTLAKARPDAFLPELAGSLNNHGMVLSNLGWREDALKASEEAVEIYRTLAKERPDAFLPDLAMSLSNLGIRLSNLGRREDALKASEEAVEIYRTLAKERPEAFLPDLAMSLGARSQILASHGRTSEAALAAGEGLALLKPLAAQHPATFGSLVRNLLGTYLQHCDAAGLAPDQELVAGVDTILSEASASDEVSEALEALKDLVAAILKKAEETGELDEELMEQLPAEIREQLVAAMQEGRNEDT